MMMTCALLQLDFHDAHPCTDSLTWQFEQALALSREKTWLILVNDQRMPAESFADFKVPGSEVFPAPKGETPSL